MGSISLSNAKIPTDFQVDIKTKEELNDDDCLFFYLMYNNPQFRFKQDRINSWDNASIRRILQNKYSKRFIRKSLGKLQREGVICVQYKHIPAVGRWWREISVSKNDPQNEYLNDWIIRNSEKIEIDRNLEADKKDKLFANEDFLMDLRIDSDNTEPLTEEDYFVFAIILHLEGGVAGNAIRYSNSHLREISQNRYSDAFIYESLGKLEREGLIRMTVLKVLQTNIYWREIVVVPGFSKNQGVLEWFSKFQNKIA